MFFVYVVGLSGSFGFGFPVDSGTRILLSLAGLSPEFELFPQILHPNATLGGKTISQTFNSRHHTSAIPCYRT